MIWRIFARLDTIWTEKSLDDSTSQSVKTAIICPTPLLSQYAQTPDRYHLILSKLVLENREYAHYYRSRAVEGDFVILDNMAHEEKVGMSTASLIEAWRLTLSHEIVLPDRLFFGEDTVELSTAARADLSRDLPPEVKFMAVPQGRTLQEWGDCARALLDLGISTIGISKDYEVWPGGLLQLVKLVRLFDGEVDIHLLGWGRDMAQLNKIAESTFKVRGVDSAKPLVYALSGTRLDGSAHKYPGRHPEFFYVDTIPDDIARANIAFFRSAAHSLHGLPESLTTVHPRSS